MKRKYLEIKGETKLSSVEKYTVDNYNESGIYINVDENNILELIIVDKRNLQYGWGFVIANEGEVSSEAINIVTEIPTEVITETKHTGISEDFMLKALAVATGKVKEVEL